MDVQLKPWSGQCRPKFWDVLLKFKRLKHDISFSRFGDSRNKKVFQKCWIQNNLNQCNYNLPWSSCELFLAEKFGNYVYTTVTKALIEQIIRWIIFSYYWLSCEYYGWVNPCGNLLHNLYSESIALTITIFWLFFKIFENEINLDVMFV